MKKTTTWILVFGAGYSTREGIEHGNWKLFVIALLLLGIAVLGSERH